MPVPISLIVDDGAPINLAHCIHPETPTPAVIPNAFTRDFADLCASYGVRGKFSVLPIPGGLGRLDRKVNYVPSGHVRGFLKIVRERIAPRFDITPEILTHASAWRLPSGGALHVFEDVWFERARLSEMTDYIALALRILKKVGLPANGVTSPWSTGISREKTYARAIAQAQWRVHRRKFTWYFLHCLCPKTARWPWVSYRSRKTGQTVVSVPATTGDAFWATQNHRTRRAARAAAEEGVDRLLDRRGAGGQVRELSDRKVPIVLLTHWQSLFSDGRAAGLWGLERLLKRIEKAFCEQVRWTTCKDLARSALRPCAVSQEPKEPG